MQASPKGIAARIGTGAAGLILVLVIVAAVCLILANLRVRVDLTQQRLFSLSSGTKQILAKLPDEVRLKFYFSRSSPDASVDLKAYARHVEDLLQEYRIAGHGKIVLETYDPQPDSDYEDAAQRDGVEPQPVPPYGQQLYFGLVAKCGSEAQALPAISPRDDARLEYDVTRLVSRVAFPKKPVIGVLSTLPVLGQPQNPMMMMQPQPRDEGWLAFRELKEDHDVRTVATDVDRIDPEIGTLIVFHPKSLAAKTLFAIDQFVLRGGRLIACVDPFSAVDQRNSPETNPMMRMMGGGAPSTLGTLFETWGVGFDTGKVIADLHAVTRLQGQGQILESPTFLSVNPDGLNHDDVLMAQISRIMMPFAGSLVDRTGGKLAFTSLIASSPDASCPIDAMGAAFASVTSIGAQFKPDNMRHVLAARLKGTFKTAFPNGLPASEGGQTNASPNQLVSGDSVVMIFADTDFLADENCVRMEPTLFGMQSIRPLNDNLALFANAVEQFSGREELIGLRSRGSFTRPFKVVDNLEARAMQVWQDKEKELSKELEDTRNQLQQLQRPEQGSQKMLLSREQQAAIERFRAQAARINLELKNVRKSLRKDIEDLGRWVKTIDIAAIPVLVVVFGVVRLSRRRRRV